MALFHVLRSIFTLLRFNILVSLSSSWGSAVSPWNIFITAMFVL
jgi:hypothetical protein